MQQLLTSSIVSQGSGSIISKEFSSLHYDQLYVIKIIYYFWNRHYCSDNNRRKNSTNNLKISESLLSKIKYTQNKEENQNNEEAEQRSLFEFQILYIANEKSNCVWDWQKFFCVPRERNHSQKFSWKNFKTKIGPQILFKIRLWTPSSVTLRTAPGEEVAAIFTIWSFLLLLLLIWYYTVFCYYSLFMFSHFKIKKY